MSQRYFQDEYACRLYRTRDEDQMSDDDIVLSSDEQRIMNENCKYMDGLDEVQKQEGNVKDASELYIRGWMQATNLVIGCVVLGIFIYRDK